MNITKNKDNLRDKVERIVKERLKGDHPGYVYFRINEIAKDIELLRKLRDKAELPGEIIVGQELVQHFRRAAQNRYERFKLHCIEFWQEWFCMDNFDIIKLMELV